ncbi:MAG: hypothetical protein AAFY25_02390 [Pseudomonadota bacterium]
MNASVDMAVAVELKYRPEYLAIGSDIEAALTANHNRFSLNSVAGDRPPG